MTLTVRQTTIDSGKYVIGISAPQFSISSIRYGLIKILQLLIKMTLNSDLMISLGYVESIRIVTSD